MWFVVAVCKVPEWEYGHVTRTVHWNETENGWDEAFATPYRTREEAEQVAVFKGGWAIARKGYVAVMSLEEVYAHYGIA